MNSSMCTLYCIRYLYLHGIDQDLSREPEFVERCMQCIIAAIGTLVSDPETSMQVIDRGLYLLKNHIESFRQQYAFQVFTVSNMHFRCLLSAICISGVYCQQYAFQVFTVSNMYLVELNELNAC